MFFEKGAKLILIAICTYRYLADTTVILNTTVWRVHETYAWACQQKYLHSETNKRSFKLYSKCKWVKL